MKKLIDVLWSIEKDLRIIASKYIGYDDPGPKGPLGHSIASKKQVK